MCTWTCNLFLFLSIGWPWVTPLFCDVKAVDVELEADFSADCVAVGQPALSTVYLKYKHNYLYYVLGSGNAVMQSIYNVCNISNVRILLKSSLKLM